MEINPELKRWNSRFSTSGYLFGTAPNAFLASQVAHLKPGMQSLALATGMAHGGALG